MQIAFQFLPRTKWHDGICLYVCLYTVFQKKTPTHIIGYKPSCDVKLCEEFWCQKLLKSDNL